MDLAYKRKRPPGPELTMSPDALPQLLETLLRLPPLEAAQLRELLQRLPGPRAAEEMVRRGWITQDQFSSLFPGPQQRPTPKETMLVGPGEEGPPDADGEDWSLPLGDEEDQADVAPAVEWARPVRTDEGVRLEPQTVEPVPVLSGAASAPQFGRDVSVPLVAGGNEARRRESDTDKLPRQWSGWASKGVLIWPLFISLFAGAQYFRVISALSPATRQGPREAKAGDRARAVAVPPAPPIVPRNIAKRRDDLRDSTGQNAPPPAPVAVPPAAPVAAGAPVRAEAPARAKARPQSTASLYDRVRQVVRANKTEETQRLGIGDIAYQAVPDDGSIMVGMEVTYAPFYTQNIIKSVRPIYQGPDGRRYDGPVCGNPTKVGERVVAREGYAIGAAAIATGRAGGSGIGGIQLTFMAIGADGLSPNKSYLSKWLGGYGGADARTFVNDGRPIVGIAGMRSSNPNGPNFCMCLVTTGKGALAGASGPDYTAKRRDDLLSDIEQNAKRAAPVKGPVASPKTAPPRRPMPPQ
jgi:hypothetical protein